MKQYQSKIKFDEPLLLTYLALVFIGLVMIYSSSSVLAESRFGSNFYFIKQQMLWAFVSGMMILFVYKLDLSRLAVYSGPSLLLIILLLSIVFLMPARNGSQRWMMLGPLTFQPSEIFKFGTVIYLAFSLSNPKRDIKKIKQLLFPYLPIIGTGLILILLEPDLGTAIVILMTCLGMFFLAGAKISHILYTTIPAAATAFFMVFVVGYKKARILDFIAAVGDPLKGSYQAKQAALTLGAGGLTGTGLGDGRQKLFFLPYPHTDFIFATTGEELGLIGLAGILALFMFLLYRSLKISYSQPDKFGFLLGAGITISLFVNVAVNLGVVTSLLPVTGLPLPFLSYGGTSLLVSSMSIGLLLNLSKRSGKGQLRWKQ